jgi:hypothetical protein
MVVSRATSGIRLRSRAITQLCDTWVPPCEFFTTSGAGLLSTHSPHSANVCFRLRADLVPCEPYQFSETLQKNIREVRKCLPVRFGPNLLKL